MTVDKTKLLQDLEPIVNKLAWEILGKDHDPEVFNDAKQDAYLAALEAVHRYDDTRGATVSTFLYPVIRFAIIKSVARWYDTGGLDTVSLSDFQEGDEGEPASLPDDWLSDNGSWQDETDREIDRARYLKSLPEQSRKVLVLIAEGYTQAEIGDMLEVSQQRISQIVAAYNPEV